MDHELNPSANAIVNVRIPAAQGWTTVAANAWAAAIYGSLRCELRLEEELAEGVYQVTVFTFTDLGEASAFIDSLATVYERQRE